MKFNNKTIRKAVKTFYEDKYLAIQLYGQINDWDVSQVTDMSYLFQDEEDAIMFTLKWA